MASGGNRIDFTVGYTVDKTGLNDLQNSLQKVIDEFNKAELGNNMTKELEEANTAALKLKDALNESWNSKLGQLDMSKLTQEMSSANLSAENLKQTMEASGSVGADAYNKFASSILSTNVELKETNKFLDNMATTMANTVKWNISSRAMNALVGAIQSAWSFSKELDTSLNNIRIVTEKSAEDMAAFAESANTAAKALGASTTDYTDASLIYYQQGLSDEEVAARTEVTLKAANVTKQSAQEVSDELTAVWNGYQVTAQEAESSIDVLAAVAANTASNLEELSTGMSKVASAANAMGVSEEQLAAQISTIVSATRQAPETTGQALKTVYARMSTINAGGEDEDDGATLTSYTAKMDKFGISVLDANGKLRDMGDVIEEIGDKWDNFTREQQISLAQAMAGTRQYNNLLTLFENWDQYTNTLEIAENATGTLQKQQDIYMESTAAHLQQLGTTVEETYNTLFDMNSINGLIDGITTLVEILNNFLSSLGGGMNTLAMLGVIGVNVFSNQIGKAINNTISSQERMKNNQEVLNKQIKTANQEMSKNRTNQYEVEAYSQQAENAKKLQSIIKGLSQEEYKNLNDLNTEITNTGLKIAELQTQQDKNTTSTLLKADLEEQEKILNEQNQTYTTIAQSIEKITDKTRERKELSDAELEIYNVIDDQLNINQVIREDELATEEDLLFTEEQQKILLEAQTKLGEDQHLTEEELNNILDITLQNRNKQQKVVEETTHELEIQKQVEEGLTEELKKQQSDNQENYNTTIATKQRQQEIVNTTKLFSALTMSINTVVNTVKILNNEDLSPWEKFEQIGSNLLMTIPMLAMSFKSLGIELIDVQVEAAHLLITFLSLSPEIYALMGIIVGAITAIGIVVNQINKIYNSTSIEAEKAAEAAERLADANNEVTESVTNLNNMTDAYETAKSKLDECTGSTEDWKEALDESNQAALDLINSISAIDLKNAGLDSINDLYENKDGIIVINEENLQKITDAAETLSASSELASAYGDYSAEVAQSSSDLVNAVRAIANNGPVTSETTTSTINEREWVDIISENLEYLNKNTEGLDEFKTKLSKLGLNISGLSDNEIQTLQTSLGDLETASDAAAKKLKLIGETEIQDIMSGEDLDEGQTTILGNYLKEQQDEITDIVSRLLGTGKVTDEEKEKIGYEGSSSNRDKQLQWVIEELQKTGRNYEAAATPITGAGDDLQYHFIDKDTGEEVDAMAKTVIADLIGSSQALEQFGTTIEDSSQGVKDVEYAYEDFRNTLEHEAGSGLVDALTGFAETGDFDLSATFGDINSLFADSDNYQSVEEAISAYLQQVVIDAVDGIETPDEADELLKQWFNTDNYAKEIADAAATYNEAFENAGTQYVQSVQEVINGFDQENLSKTAKDTVGKVLENTLIDAGSEAMVQMKGILGSLDRSGNLNEMMNAINDLDASDTTLSVTSLKDTLKEAGVQIDLTDDQLELLINAFNNSEESLQTVQEKYSAINNIIDGMEDGSEISTENYETLRQELGDSISDFFQETLEGTYKLVGSAEEFKNIAQQTIQDVAAEAQQSYAERISQATDLNKNLNNQIGGLQDALSTIDNSQTLDPETEKNILNLIDEYQQLTDATEEERREFQELKESMADGFDDSEIEKIREYINEIIKTGEETDSFTQYITENTAEMQALSEQYTNSINNISDLDAAYEAGIITIEDYTRAYEDLREAERMEGLDADEVEDYAAYLQDVCDASEDLSPDLKDNDKAAKNLAAQIMKMNNGVDELADNFDDWSNVLNTQSAESYDYCQALEGMRSAMSDLLDISEDYIDDKTILDNMEDIQLAAQGDEDAIDRLRAATLESIVQEIALDDSQISEEELSNKVNNLQGMLDDMGDLEVGAEIDDADFITACNDMIAEAGLTADQVTELFSGMGYDVTFEENDEPVTTQVPVYTEHYKVNKSTETIRSVGDNSLDIVETTIEVPTIEHYTTVDRYEPVEGTAAAFAMQTSEPGTTATPTISSITKKAGGSMNHSSSHNGGGSSGGSGGSSGGSGGSGGGGKSKTKTEPKKVDNIEDEADRYHDVNIRLREISTTLSRLQKQEDKLFGAALIDNLNKQLSTLNDQMDATNDKLSIAQQESKEMQKELSKNYGIKFDANGDISNYEQVYAKELAKVNKVIDKYNSKSAKGQEKYQEKYDAALKEWDDFLQGISDYDDLQENISGLKDDLQDINDAMTQLRIQKFTMEIEIRLDMSQAERDWNEFYRKVILGIDSDDIMGNAVQNLADIVSYYSTGTVDTAINGSLDDWLTSIDSVLNNSGTGSIQGLTDQIYNTLDQLAQIDKKGSSSVYGEDRERALEDLSTYYEELMSELGDVYDLVKAIEDSYLDMIDEAIDAFDEQVDQYEYINDLLNHDINLVSLIYGDDAYETMNKYYEQIEANNNEELDFLRKRVDYAAAMMEAETDDEARKKWEEEWENALSDLNDKVEDSVQNIIDKYANVINQIISEMNDAITGGLGLDYVGEEWDLLNQDAEIYLDTINRLYSLQDLQNKWQTAIDETDDIAAQRTLSELMEQQLEYLEEKGELTQHDIDRAELEYEIALKQIALEEAQRNKSTMRLRRDANGNYTYQYVSDTSEVEAAQQELAELQNQLYNLDVDAYQENLDQIYSIYKDFEEKIAEVYEDQTLSEQERDQQIALYTEQYSSMLDKYLTENSYLRANLEDSAFKSLAALSDVELDALEALSDEEKDELMSSLIPQWDSSVQHMVDTFNENGGLMSTCQDFLDALDQALDDYENSLSEMADSAGVSLDDLASGYDATTESVQKLIENNDDLIDSWSDQVDAMEAIVQKAEEMKDGFDAYTESAKKAAEAAKNYIETANEAAAQAAHDDDAAGNGNSGNDNSGGGNSGSDSNSDNGKNTQGDGKVQVGDKVEFIKGVYHNLSSGGKTGDKHKGTGKKLYVTKKKSGADYPIRLSTKDEPENENTYKLGWVKKRQISGYDTGGYTGDWDDEEGRLGVLHKKEMVLNKADTVNLLNAVGIVRDVATMLNNLNTSMFSKMSSLKTGSIKSKLKEHKDKVLKQDVHIEANFPNVRDSAEIEQAFNNLVNVASQHAYNTQR